MVITLKPLNPQQHQEMRKRIEEEKRKAAAEETLKQPTVIVDIQPVAVEQIPKVVAVKEKTPEAVILTPSKYRNRINIQLTCDLKKFTY